MPSEEVKHFSIDPFHIESIAQAVHIYLYLPIHIEIYTASSEVVQQ